MIHTIALPSCAYVVRILSDAADPGVRIGTPMAVRPGRDARPEGRTRRVVERPGQGRPAPDRPRPAGTIRISPGPPPDRRPRRESGSLGRFLTRNPASFGRAVSRIGYVSQSRGDPARRGSAVGDPREGNPAGSYRFQPQPPLPGVLCRRKTHPTPPADPQNSSFPRGASERVCAARVCGAGSTRD